MTPDPLHVLELRSVRGTGGGPEKTILLGARGGERARVAVTVCYLRDRRDPAFDIDRRAAALGADYVELVERHSLDPLVWPRLRRLVRDRQIDIVHGHDYKTDLLAWLLAGVEPVVPLATAHGWTGHSMRERLVYYPIDKRLLRAFPMTVAVSGEIRRELERVGVPPERIRVILNGIDAHAAHRDPRRGVEARRRLGVAEGDIVIGAVGRLEPQKRFDLLLRACADVRANWPRLRIAIAGAGSLHGELQALAAELFPPGVCRLLGQWDDVGLLHHALDLFVQTSDYEGTSNALLEAMAYETPVVATLAGGTAEMIDDGVHALTVACNDRRALALAIDAALAYPDAAAARAAAARRAVESRFSFEARTAALEAVYLELAGRVESRRAA